MNITSILTKTLLGVGIPFVIAALGYISANGLYVTQGHHGDEHYLASKDQGAEAEEQQEAAAEPTFADLYAQADLKKGAKVFGKCKACHKLETGANATGPYLSGVVGRDVASVSDFAYSDTMKGLGGQWTPERMNTFLTKPKDMVPGTMSFAGLKKMDQRANLIAYLASVTE